VSIAISAPHVGVATSNLVIAIDGPVALFLDVDGTLLDFADRPSAVATPAGLVQTLQKAERKLGGALALISGRRIDELDHLFEPLRLRASGVHGAQFRFDPDEEPTAAAGAVELPDSLWPAVTDILADFPGVLAENKRYSIAVHYRVAPEAKAPLRERIMRLIEAAPWTAVQVMHAHRAFELKARGFDKGTAIAAFLATPAFRGRTPIFVGDDVTDESGFAVVAAHGGYAYSVGWRRPGAMAAFSSPSAVRDWLAAFANRGDGA
jgi:trehalose 6-phosphate phosphatase